MTEFHRQMLVRIEREQRAIERRYQSQGRAFSRTIRLHAIAAARIGDEIDQAIHNVIYGNPQIDQDGMQKWIAAMIGIAFWLGQRRAMLENEKLAASAPLVDAIVDLNSPSSLLHHGREILDDFYGGITKAIQRYRGNDDLGDLSREQVTREALKSQGITPEPDDAWALPKLIGVIVGLGYSGGFDRGTEAQDDVAAFRYSTMRDDRVRENHAKMEGVTRRKDDPVWQRWTPPCGWGCRCRRLPIYSWQTFTETRVPNVDPDPGWDRTLRVLSI